MEKNLFHRTTGTLAEWLRYHFVTKKMTTPLGIALFGFMAIAIAYITVLVDFKLSLGLVSAFGIVLLCALCIVYPLFGFYASYVSSLFLLFPTRIMNTAMPLPTGMIPEYLAYLALLGVLTRQNLRKEINSQFWTYSITIWMMVLLAYNLLQLVNPSMGSAFGWFNFFRKQVSFVAFFYISFCFLNSRKAITRFTKFWIVISTIEALYACKQQWFGFFEFEHVWLMSDPKRIDLFINWGFIRRFGLLSDPAAAGILYSCSTVLMLVLALRAKKIQQQLLYYSLTVIHFMASSYTGTRTGTMMIIAGIVFYCVLTLYERKTLIFSAFIGFMITVLMVVPIYDNPIINRLRSTFEGSKDPSAMARDINRKIVQPYAYRHPIGGGLNSAGMMGLMYSPGHPMAIIPPDSGYMQAMMEQGPIGLALLLIFYYVILRTGIKCYYRLRDPGLQTTCVAHLVAIFTMMVAQFSQLAIGQYPSVLYFYSVLALLLKMPKYDSTKPIIIAQDKL